MQNNTQDLVIAPGFPPTSTMSEEDLRKFDEEFSEKVGPRLRELKRARAQSEMDARRIFIYR